jgi:hypothetical protein
MSHTHTQSPAPLRDVLYEFSLAKEVPDAELVNEFARRYPEHAEEITRFAIEVVVASLRPDAAEEPVVTTAVSPMVSRAMSRFQNALYANRAKATAPIENTSYAVVVDNPFAKLDRKAFRQLAHDLNANVVFVCKLRDCQIDPKTMSQGFLQFLADKMRVVRDTLDAFFAGGVRPIAQPQFFKADQRPEGNLQQSFEEAVRGSDLSEEQQDHLMSL